MWPRTGRRHAARVWILVTVSVVMLAGLPLAAHARSETTAPGTVYIIPMTLTNKAIVLPPDKFSRGLKYPRYPRGAAIQYRVINKGTRPYAVKIWNSTTQVIQPGHHDSILLNWNYRGKFPYETLYRGKPLGPRGRVTIF
jgi:hypothetical protein